MWDWIYFLIKQSNCAYEKTSRNFKARGFNNSHIRLGGA